MATKIEEIEKRMAQLKEQHAAILAREAKKERAARDRQNIILGAWVRANRPEVMDQALAALTRNQDRRAFGLEPLPTEHVLDDFKPTF